MCPVTFAVRRHGDTASSSFNRSLTLLLRRSGFVPRRARSCVSGFDPSDGFSRFALDLRVPLSGARFGNGLLAHLGASESERPATREGDQPRLLFVVTTTPPLCGAGSLRSG